VRVVLIASTIFYDHDAEESTGYRWVSNPFPPGQGESSQLSEFAGRECYQSWDKPNAETATNEGYLRNIIQQQHFSVLEHGMASFRVMDVSRSLTHELVRHRHLSFSQLSQRYVDMGGVDPVIPPDLRGDNEALDILKFVWAGAQAAYEELVERLEKGGMARKRARQAARCVLPNMTPTSLVVTGNHRAWREMIVKRISPHADTEIQELAHNVLRQLLEIEPNIYADLKGLL